MTSSGQIWNLYRWTLITAVFSKKVLDLNCVCANYVYDTELNFYSTIHWNIFIIKSFINRSSPIWQAHCDCTNANIFTTTTHTILFPVTHYLRYLFPKFYLKKIPSLCPFKSYDFILVTQSEYNYTTYLPFLTELSAVNWTSDFHCSMSHHPWLTTPMFWLQVSLPNIISLSVRITYNSTTMRWSTQCTTVLRSFQAQYSDTSANEDNSFRNHIR
jgi:hypothetical protein